MDDALKNKLDGLIQKDPIMLFMKGDRDNPLCGFSAELCNILNKENATYTTFDILSDEDVRQGAGCPLLMLRSERIRQGAEWTPGPRRV